MEKVELTKNEFREKYKFYFAKSFSEAFIEKEGLIVQDDEIIVRPWMAGKYHLVLRSDEK